MSRQSKKPKLQQDPPYQLLEQLKLKNKELSQLTQECSSLKLKVWELKSQKDWLSQELSKEASKENTDCFLKDLKEKYEHCRGTKLEKLLLSLIKAYERYNNQSTAFSFLNKEKEEILQSYQKVTNNLSQESNLRNKIKYLQEFSEEKERSTNELEIALRKIRKEVQEVKEYLDMCDVKKLLEQKEQVIEQTNKCIEDQKVLLIELSKIDQTIELEKNINKITPDICNRVLKKNVADVEDLISETVKSIKSKEKIRENLKIQIQKIERKHKEVIEKPVKTSRSVTANSTPKSVKSSAASFGFSPQNKKAPDRDSIIMMLSKGINLNNSERIQKILGSFGSQTQSFASKIVDLNRGSITSKGS